MPDKLDWLVLLMLMMIKSMEYTVEETMPIKYSWLLLIKHSVSLDLKILIEVWGLNYAALYSSVCSFQIQ